MKISPLNTQRSNQIKRTPIKNIQKETKHNNNVSFKSIYLESIVDVGHVKAGSYPAKFATKDALLIHELAQEYPYQDCFIRKSVGNLPRLEFREKPIEVPVFNASLGGTYNIALDPSDEKYETVQMILYEDDEPGTYKIPEMNFQIGVPSYISTNPSLQYTIKVGFECHKKLMEKKYQILDVLGQNEQFSLGDDSLITKAHKGMEEVEIAAIRYLLECAYTSLTNKASAKQIYESIYPKIQSTLDAKRKFDLVTCKSQQPKEENKGDGIDFCTHITEVYPNTVENIERINELMKYMSDNGISLYDSEDFRASNK